jgi:hypothetical protein
MVAELHSAIHRPFQESASTRPVGRACPPQRPRTNAAVPITRSGSRVRNPRWPCHALRENADNPNRGARPACGQLLDEIGHDTGMSNDTADANGTIGSRVALDESEVDPQLAQDRYSNRALFGTRVIAIPLGNRAEANREQLSRATRPNCEATPSPYGERR